ncbi:MAG: hypothetical protein IPL39_23810 [Opitutaceae bacterium]|nr:hypothetical protein [Opitutaceae bacterium]
MDAQAGVTHFRKQAGRIAQHAVGEIAAHEGQRLHMGGAEFAQGRGRGAEDRVDELQLEGQAVGAPQGILRHETDRADLGRSKLGEAAGHRLTALGEGGGGTLGGKRTHGGEIDLRALDLGDGERREQ